jgi:4a-hydroxytetrahydrobiopterin dehydratase
MTDPPALGRFHELGWRILRDVPGRASAHFRTGSFAAGTAFVNAIASVSDGAADPPDVDLRSDGVTVTLTNHANGWLTEDHVALAGRISRIAQGSAFPVDVTRVQELQIAIDALVIPDVLPFWRAVLGYAEGDEEGAQDPHRRGPWLWFQQMDEPRPQRNRIHIDLYVAHDQAEARVAAALAAGGHVVNDEHAPGWWTLADAEGNEVDVASWPDRD